MRKIELTRREYDCLIRITKSYIDIAYELNLAENTIKTYMFRLFVKLGVKNRTECAIKAIRLELIDPYAFQL